MSPYEAITQVLFTYAERVDRADFDGVGELFAHGRIVGDPATPEHDIVGAEAVAAMYRATVRVHPCGTPRTHHLTTNVMIDLDEGDDPIRARSRSSYTVFQQVDDGPLAPIICGRYTDELVRVDGTWGFESRHMTVSLVGDLRRHLTIEVPAP